MPHGDGEGALYEAGTLQNITGGAVICQLVQMQIHEGHVNTGRGLVLGMTFAPEQGAWGRRSRARAGKGGRVGRVSGPCHSVTCFYLESKT